MRGNADLPAVSHLAVSHHVTLLLDNLCHGCVTPGAIQAICIGNERRDDCRTLPGRASHSVGGSGRDRLLGGVPSVDVVVELVVEHACPDLEEAVCSGGCPSHLLFLDHPFRDHLIDSALGRS